MKRYLKAFVAPQIPENVGDVHLTWGFPEYVKESRSKSWYIGIAVILGILVLYAAITVNYLFVVILVLGVFTVVFQYFQEPRTVPVLISEDGVQVDQQFYPYRVLKSFWLAYDPPEVKYLYLEFKEGYKKGLPVPLEHINPLQVREALLNYIDEDLEKDEESFDETFSRMVKIR